MSSNKKTNNKNPNLDLNPSKKVDQSKKKIVNSSTSISNAKQKPSTQKYTFDKSYLTYFLHGLISLEWWNYVFFFWFWILMFVCSLPAAVLGCISLIPITLCLPFGIIVGLIEKKSL